MLYISSSINLKDSEDLRKLLTFNLKLLLEDFIIVLETTFLEYFSIENVVDHVILVDQLRFT